ncbi:mRNA guanylyltransferase [Lentinula raphanica]|uniref:mRNA-capping enzyme subunit alpha n=1 Tax=Lentinula raphanica TaxID=153919 RepID=A0AA38UG27_9AGAR|nr:mRNA guanylyltransferase [Lentinula raphanica]KAJ3839851.1 mRNA guanylyltransferase [Lentinula raphanica]
MPIPDLPGELIQKHSPQESWLKSHVAQLCHLENERFPGSQPVSFGTRDLLKLESQDFWVCEKSDGVRVLMLILFNQTGQRVFLIDRHNTYREVVGLFFPHHENPINPLRNTLIDGELVIDTDPRTRRETTRLLVFDCLVVDDQNVMSRPLDKRYGRLKEWFYRPYAKMIRDHPHVAASQPFEVQVKEIRSAYNVEQVFAVDIPALQHGNDGLIYTCVSTPYIPGTDSNIIKWKPPTENSIDFKLILRFPSLPSSPSQPDFRAKPIFLLHVWCGDHNGTPRYEQYDTMYVDDDEWEKMKASGQQFDDRIVEVHWDPSVKGWRMMRFRSDKPNGNHKSVVENIITSIADGVEKETLLSRSNHIRTAWKARQGASNHNQNPAPLPARPPPPPQAPQAPPAVSSVARPSQSIPQVELRYGPLQSSIYSKVAGPRALFGFER